ncbi:F-box/FBD/LRR-repeat protein At1g13570-like [Solanum stenotomum]|uniref:F-box/FBD/LRR-repeat protein At1g13570-like n=1 Tax=Solanum stenotomum TaxID=172797 RepID=UPI0020D0A3A1|nr:F-box/FBD/LRR-repeat protein At1g13570-like [Solanum stenotomum]
MADILPECLVQKILSFLPSYNQASKMSILSKTWLQAWSTLPNLKIFLFCWESRTKIVDTIMERYGKGKIPIQKFELSEIFADSLQLFPMVDKWLLIALENGVKELVLHFKSYPAPILTILAAKSLRELVLHDCTLMPVSLASGVVNCSSLRKISLSNVTLDENMLQTLLNSCPLIVSFIVENCSGMNVLKIKSASLKVLKIIQYCKICNIDAPNLVSLDYKGYEIPELNIARESKIILHCLLSLNTAWFCKLRKFLSNSSSWSEVSLCILKCDEINMTDVQMDHIGSSGGVDVLNLNMLLMDEIIECPTFVDALLWSCHPGRLNLISIDIETVTRLIDRLMYMKNLSHSTSHASTPWNSQLKDVKAFDRKNQLLQLGSEELAKRIMETYFILDW